MRSSTCNSIVAFCGLVLLLFVFHLDASGQTQGGFIPDVPNSTAHVAASDGKVIVATPHGLIRLNADGTRNAVLSNQGGEVVELQADGKILLGVDSRAASGTSRVLRFNADGTPDSIFNCPRDPSLGANYINSIAIAPDGDIYILDVFGDGAGRIVRLNPDGSADPGFVPITGVPPATELYVGSGGKLLVGGKVENSSLGSFSLIRVNHDGTRDSSFTFNPASFAGARQVMTVLELPDGKYLVGGAFAVGTMWDGLVRINNDGSVDSTFVVSVPQFLATVSFLNVRPDGKILVGGSISYVEPGVPNQQFTWLMRLNPDGSRDSAFKLYPRGSYSTTDISVTADGTIYLSGRPGFLSSGPLSVARLSPNGVPDLPYSGFDFNGDKATDFTVFRPSAGEWYFKTSQYLASCSWGVSTDVPVPADYDGDGKTDIAVYRPSEGVWYVVNSSNSTWTYLPWGQPGDIPLAQNTFGDRKASFTIFRPSNSTWYRWEGTTRNINVVAFGQPGDIPLVGRYTNSHGFQSSLIVYRPSTGTFIANSFNTDPGPADLQVQWGEPGEIPVAGDFDNDYMTDIAVYRPSDGRWRIRLSRSGETLLRNWGEPGDIPVPGDYDGDRSDDVAVFRPSTGQWFIWGSTAGLYAESWGQAGDRPAPASYLSIP